MNNPGSTEKPSFKEALQFWFKLGWISFGGTAGHIAIMHDYLVDKKKWISNSRFFHALSLCMLLPGPEAQQLAIYIGWKLHGKKGGIAAGSLFVLPSMFILLILSIVYVLYGNLPWIHALFNGLKPAVIALIVTALFKVARKALYGALQWVVAVMAFAFLFFFNLSVLFIICGTILLALGLIYLRPSLLHKAQTRKERESQDEPIYFLNKDTVATDAGFKTGNLFLQVAIFFLCWACPLFLFYLFAADFSFWKALILFWTRAAFFTIGGSYTVLPYVAQFAVGKLHWLTKSQMVDGFALAETTPGPLIIVVSFVGFMAGYHHFNGSLWMGSIALAATTFYTFLPCFLFIFIGGPLIERTHGNTVVENVLGLVTAAVVGIILNLTLFLGKDVLFPAGASPGHVDLFSLFWVILSLLLILTFKMNVIYLIILSLLYGLIRYLLHC